MCQSTDRYPLVYQHNLNGDKCHELSYVVYPFYFLITGRVWSTARVGCSELASLHKLLSGTVGMPRYPSCDVEGRRQATKAPSARRDRNAGDSTCSTEHHNLYPSFPGSTLMPPIHAVGSDVNAGHQNLFSTLLLSRQAALILYDAHDVASGCVLRTCHWAQSLIPSQLLPQYVHDKQCNRLFSYIQLLRDRRLDLQS